jgi:hypothetical protein
MVDAVACHFVQQGFTGIRNIKEIQNNNNVACRIAFTFIRSQSRVS